MNDKRGFLSFIGILLVLIIVSLLSYLILKTYFKKSSSDKNTEGILSEEGISITNPKSTLDTVRDKIGEVNKRQLGQERNMENMR